MASVREGDWALDRASGWNLLDGSVFPRKLTLWPTESKQGVWTGGFINCNALQNRVFEARAGVNVRMGVVSRLTDRYCERAQVLMENSTGGQLSFRTLPLAVSSLRLSWTETLLKCHCAKGLNGRHPRGQADLYCNQVICDNLTSHKRVSNGEK